MNYIIKNKRLSRFRFHAFCKRGVVGVCVLLMLFTNSSLAQTTTVKATTDKSKILLGEPFWLTLEIKALNDNNVKSFELDTIPHFEFITKDSIERKINGDTTIINQYYQLTSFDSGQWVIPPIILRPYIKTNSVLIDVGYTEGFDPQQPYKDVKPLKEIPFKLDASIEKWWYLIALILILIVLIIYKATDPKKKIITNNVSPASAFKRAMASLLELRASNEKDEKLFFSKLVEIYRTYIWERAGISSMQQTTNDMIDKMKPLYFDDKAYGNMSQVLQLCNFVKFAKYHPNSSERQSALDTTEQSIKLLEDWLKNKKLED